MALASGLTLEVYTAREHSDLGSRFLRFAVALLMPLSILAPVVRITSDLWIKVDQLLLPVIAAGYLCLVLAGLARPIRLNALFLVASLFCICVALSILYGTQIIGHPLLLRDLFDLLKPFFPWLFFTLGIEAEFSEDSLRTLNIVLLGSILLICLYGIGQWFSMGFTLYLQPYYSGGVHDDGSLAHYRRVYSTLSNPNFLGMLMTWVITAFTFAALLRVGGRVWNVLILLASLATLTMTGSRYGLIDTGMAMILIVFLSSAGARSKGRTTVLVIALILVVATVLVVSSTNQATTERFQDLQNPLKENSLRARLDSLWQDAADQFLESPLLGHGPAKIIFSNVYTDSEYLQILKQYGIVGLVPYLCFFLLPLSEVWKGIRAGLRSPWIEQQRPATWWSLCLAFVMIVTAIFMNIGMGTYYNFSLAAFLWLWMGIGVNSARRIRGQSLENDSSRNAAISH